MILSEAEVGCLKTLAMSGWSGDALSAARGVPGLAESHEELRRERDRLADQLAELQDKYDKHVALADEQNKLVGELAEALSVFCPQHPGFGESATSMGVDRLRQFVVAEQLLLRPAVQEALKARQGEK